ncbi:MAG: hypothetical protein M3165_02130 [Actinomycetota bacterium]|nr:hypothetical protein [Actinomycetota bacterium]
MTTDLRRVEVAPERLAGWLDRFGARHGEPTVLPAGGGLRVSAADGAFATLLPPWPDPLEPRSPEHLTGVELLERFVVEVRRPRTVGVLLVRRGGYAVGVAAGGRLVDSKVGSRHVQGRTKAGGWSQRRYARRRDAQAQSAFAAAADTAARILLPRLGGSAGTDGREVLEGLVMGGDRAAVSSVLADSRLRRLADLPHGRFLGVPDPRRRVLEDAVQRGRAVVVDVYDPLRGTARGDGAEPPP